MWGGTSGGSTARGGARNFNPPSPCGERPRGAARSLHLLSISIHAPRVGSDPTLAPAALSDHYFNPRSPCGERRHRWNLPDLHHHISIHAPRVGSDRQHRLLHRHLPDFNPRSPCGERPNANMKSSLTSRFQSTLPVWGATGAFGHAQKLPADFNPRSPCGERLGRRARSPRPSRISIHAPRVGSDPPRQTLRGHFERFQSTLPVWGATRGLESGHKAGNNFNPRSPCGERQHSRDPNHYLLDISIHAPRVGSDLRKMGFNVTIHISIHAPRVGSDFAFPCICAHL